MSSRTIRIIELLSDAQIAQRLADTTKREIALYADKPSWQKAAEDECHRWTEKRDKAVGRLRLLLGRLDDRERRHLIRRFSPDLDVQMRTVGIELPWWKNYAADLSL
jgi:hypothetical protein